MKFCTILAIASIVVFHLTSAQVDPRSYCEPEFCPEGVTHVGCNYTIYYAEPCPIRRRGQYVSEPIRKRILAKHNELRNCVAGGKIPKFKKAARMAYMKWSLALARIADYNIWKCEMDYDECRNSKIFKNAGQNLALSSWSGEKRTIEDVAIQQIDSWFSEFRSTTMRDINSYSVPANGREIRDFTQLMQENSFTVGCSIARYKIGRRTYQQMCCNYAVTNTLDQPVYESANIAGVGCATGRQRNYENLCSGDERCVPSGMHQYSTCPGNFYAQRS